MGNLLTRIRMERGKSQKLELAEAAEFLRRNGVELKELGLPKFSEPMDYAQTFHGLRQTFHDLRIRPEDGGTKLRVTGVCYYAAIQSSEDIRDYGLIKGTSEDINYVANLKK